MAFEFHLPDIGEGVVEGEIVSWKVKVGDKIKLDQPIVEIMTDKATVEIPSPRAGTVTKLNFKEGEICPVGQVLLAIEEDGVGEPAAPKKVHAPTSVVAPRAMTASPPNGGAGVIAVVDASHDRLRVLATPATRRLARQLGVEIGRVPATGNHGRVTTDDVKNYKQQPPTRATASYTPQSIAKGGED